MFGSPETQPGGRALKFYSSQRLDIRRIETLKEGTEAVGNRVRVKVVKNKVAAPFRQAEFDIEYGEGISHRGLHPRPRRSSTTIVTKCGSFFSYGDERLGQGRNNAKAFLEEHPEIGQGDRGQDLRGARRRAATSSPPIERDDDAEARAVAIAADARGRKCRPAAGRTPGAACRRRAGERRLSASRPPRSDGGRDAPALATQAVEPERSMRRRRADGAGLPRRRPLRAAVRRGPPHARRLGRRADRAAPARRRASTAERRSRPRRGGDRESELDAAVAVLQRRFPVPPATTATASGRSALLVRTRLRRSSSPTTPSVARARVAA